MHEGEEGVIAKVSELADAALVRAQVFDGGWDIDDGEALPGEADGGFRLEIEAAGESGAGEDAAEGLNGVEAHSEEGIADAGPEGFEICPEVGNFPAIDADGGGGGVEDGFAKNESVGIQAGGFHEDGNMGGGVLPIGIHDEGVGGVSGGGQLKAGEDGGALAAIYGKPENAEGGGGEGFEAVIAAIGAAIYDYKDFFSGWQDFAEGAEEKGSGIVGRDDDTGFHSRQGRHGLRVTEMAIAKRRVPGIREEKVSGGIHCDGPTGSAGCRVDRGIRWKGFLGVPGGDRVRGETRWWGWRVRGGSRSRGGGKTRGLILRDPG